MSDIFNLIVDAEDGTHLIATEHSYDAARKEAELWLGDNATWQGPCRAVSMFGGVLTIQRCTEEEYHAIPGDDEWDDEWEEEMRREAMMLHGPEAGDCW